MWEVEAFRVSSSPVRLAALLVLALASVSLVACSPSPSTTQPPTGAPVAEAEDPTFLTSVDEAAVALFEEEVSYVEVKAEAPMYGMNRDDEMRTSLDRVIAIARAKPDADYYAEGKNRPMRLVLADAADNLRPYEPGLSEELEAVVNALPPAK